MKIQVPPIVNYEGDNITKRFAFPFDYLRKAFVKLKIDEEVVEDFEVEGKVLVLATAPARGAKIEIYRETDTNRLVSWADASVLRARDMNINDVQVLHLIEEQQVWTERNAVTLTDEDSYNFYNRVLANVADPTNDGDVVTLGYFKDTRTGVLDEINAAKADAINASTVAKGNIEALTNFTTSYISDCMSEAESTYHGHLLAMTNTKTQALTDIGNAKDSGVSSVNSARDTSVSAINTAKTEGVGSVNTAKNEALNLISSAKSDALGAIATDGTQQVNKAKAWAEENAGTTPSLIGGAKSSKQWASFAETKANTATIQADRAKTEADRAATEVSKIDFTKYLQLSGGTMTGQLKTNSSIAKSTNAAELNIFGGQGWANGSVLTLRGKDNSYLGGSFSIGAYDAVSDKLLELAGQSDGSLKWDNKEVERVNESGTDYIRFESGLQMCWGHRISVTTNYNKQGTNSMRPYGGVNNITFPAPFVDAPSVSSQIDESIAWWVSNANNISATSFDLTIAGDQANVSKYAGYIAIGRWK